MITIKQAVVLVSAVAALGVAACQPATHHARVRQQRHEVYALRDGRYAFQGDDGFWYWYILTQSQPTGQASLATGAWERGSAPSSEALASSSTVQTEVAVSEAGEPLTTAEMDAIHAEANDLGLSAEDMGGSSDASSSVDSSSSDSGGGDSGGGGGDVG